MPDVATRTRLMGHCPHMPTLPQKGLEEESQPVPQMQFSEFFSYGYIYCGCICVSCFYYRLTLEEWRV